MEFDTGMDHNGSLCSIPTVLPYSGHMGTWFVNDVELQTVHSPRIILQHQDANGASGKDPVHRHDNSRA